jgi:hypothetical protein
MQPKAVVVELTADPEAVEVILQVLLEQPVKETQADRVLTHKVVAAVALVVPEVDRVQVAAHQTTMQLAAARHIQAEAKVHHLVLKTAVILAMAVLVMAQPVEIM